MESEMSFLSIVAPTDSVEGDEMRADRLTRKTHFRKMSAKEMQTGAASGLNCDVFDLTLEPQFTDDSIARGVCSLTGLLNDARFGQLEDESKISFQSEYDALLWCARMINESPTARSLAHEIESDGWSIGLTDLKNEGFFIDNDDRLILLDHFALAPMALGRSAFFRNVLLTTFIRALRDVWHEKRLGDYDRDYAPEQILMVERVRAADCDTVTILCGWELRAAGYSEIWRHLLGAEEGDMAIVFSRFLERDPGALFNGAALAYAFRQWYADTARVDGIDHDTLEALDAIIDGADDPHPFGNNALRARFIEELSTLPDGTCYLGGLGDGILRDPFYAGLHDSINQTHLFQMMYDMEVVMVNNVPFRDPRLARMIFPHSEFVRVR